MFIRTVEHKDKKNRKKYRTYKLVKSVQTERGPRHITVLNLGTDFNLPKEHWKDLANCIEAETPHDIKMVPVKEDEKTKESLIQAGMIFNKKIDKMKLYCHPVAKEKKGSIFV